MGRNADPRPIGRRSQPQALRAAAANRGHFRSAVDRDPAEKHARVGRSLERRADKIGRPAHRLRQVANHLRFEARHGRQPGCRLGAGIRGELGQIEPGRPCRRYGLWRSSSRLPTPGSNSVQWPARPRNATTSWTLSGLGDRSGRAGVAAGSQDAREAAKFALPAVKKRAFPRGPGHNARAAPGPSLSRSRRRALRSIDAAARHGCGT